MKKNISRNPLWPDWYNGKKIDEVQFGRAFLEQWPLKCVNGTLYTLDGPVEDESEIKQRILENIEEYVTSGLSKKVTNILETIKLLAFSDPFPIEQDCIHLQNGVYHLPDGSFQESRLFCQNRLPVKYDSKAATPDRWLTFLHELLDDADIPTLQEYLGYCLIPSTKGQKMMLIVGKGGEGKSRIGLVLKRLMGDAASNGSVQKVENSSATYQLMISGGDVKAVQGTTGHASADMLVNTYAHIQQSSRVELGKKFEEGFYAKQESPSPQAVPAEGEPTISMTALLELLKNADPEVKAQLRLALLT